MLAVTRIDTDGPETLRGTDRADNLLGKGGNDALFGMGGRDNLLGARGKDWILGGNERRAQGGDKNLVGGPGNDGVLAGLGSDNALGEGGSDFFSEPTFREGAQDTCSGGPGNDVFVANNRPASRDIVTCGRGFDRVLADREDLLTPDCERSFFGLTDQEFSARVPQSFFPSLAPFPE